MADAVPMPGTGLACPNRDDRKSAALAAHRVVAEKGAQVVRSFSTGREILRSTEMRQAGIGSDEIRTDDPAKAPVFFLDGEMHRRKRAAIARFFTPRAISTRYRRVMEDTTDRLLAGMQALGRGQLDSISFELAVTVAADIVGLTNSDYPGMAKRIQAVLSQIGSLRGSWLKRRVGGIVRGLHGMRFFHKDVLPAIRARRAEPGEDVISHLLEEGYSDKAILVECMTYATAGMVTTREFIVMVAWHMFDNAELRARYVASDEAEQLVILEEILRLEPVAALLYRRASDEAQTLEGSPVPPGTFYGIDIRAANMDEAATGPCPHMLDPDRAGRMKATGSYLSFGDGAHRCPGSQVALHETRVFIDRLMRVPGIRLEREPDMHWNDELMSYELRNAILVCNRA